MLETGMKTFAEVLPWFPDQRAQSGEPTLHLGCFHQKKMITNPSSPSLCGNNCRLAGPARRALLEHSGTSGTSATPVGSPSPALRGGQRNDSSHQDGKSRLALASPTWVPSPLSLCFSHFSQVKNPGESLGLPTPLPEEAL